MAEPTTPTKPPVPGGSPKGAAALKKKMFGLPVWAWLVIGTVAIGGALYVRSKGSTGDNSDKTDDDSQVQGTYQETPADSTGTTGSSGAFEDVPDFDGAGNDGNDKKQPQVFNIYAPGSLPDPAPANGKSKDKHKNNPNKKPDKTPDKGKHWSHEDGKWTQVKNKPQKSGSKHKTDSGGKKKSQSRARYTAPTTVRAGGTMETTPLPQPIASTGHVPNKAVQVGPPQRDAVQHNVVTVGRVGNPLASGMIGQPKRPVPVKPIPRNSPKNKH